MNRKFFLTGLITSLINLLLNALAYAVFLKQFYEAHPPLSRAFMNQLHRPPGQLIGWAMAVTTLSFGYYITLVMKWSGADSIRSGLKPAFIVALLFWSAVNFGIYASSNMFSLAGVFADLGCSVTAMTLSGVFSAWMAGKWKETERKIQIVHN